MAPAEFADSGHTRPILKIQDGCNNRCSYCVIPFVRGKSRSLSPDAVIAEVRNLVDAGAKEVVLSGINLGSYGRDLTPRAELIHTARRILDETTLEQLRFSSIEPQDVTEELVELVASSERIAPHFHVPLQSGSDQIFGAHGLLVPLRTLRGADSQNSPTSRRAIGADVIVGFPGETEAEFQTTADFIEKLPLTYLHVFSFSVRPGTAAAALPEREHVAPGVIRERARFLRALGEKKAAAFRAAQLGSGRECSRWRALVKTVRSPDGKLSQGESRRPASVQRMVRRMPLVWRKRRVQF